MKLFHEQPGVTLYQGDARTLSALADDSVQCCVTSPPYWALRDYGVDGQIGLEPSPGEFVANMVAVFREVRRVLRPDGTLWLNLGDSYNAYNGNRGPAAGANKNHHEIMPELPGGYGLTDKALKPKDLIGIPWRVALALQADGWYLRCDIIWAKPNPMPESVTDRPTKSHEYLFLLSKSDRYFYDAEAVMEPCESGPSDVRKMLEGQERIGGKHKDLIDPLSKASATTNIGQKRAVGGRALGKKGEQADGSEVRSSAGARMGRGAGWRNDPEAYRLHRNCRSVWNIATAPYPGAHFATFPQALPERCILAGSKPGDLVLDPFNGSGTTGEVCRKWGRRYVGIDLNPEYLELAKDRYRQEMLFAPGGAA